MQVHRDVATQKWCMPQVNDLYVSCCSRWLMKRCTEIRVRFFKTKKLLKVNNFRPKTLNNYWIEVTLEYFYSTNSRFFLNVTRSGSKFCWFNIFRCLIVLPKIRPEFCCRAPTAFCFKTLKYYKSRQTGIIPLWLQQLKLTINLNKRHSISGNDGSHLGFELHSKFSWHAHDRPSSKNLEPFSFVLSTVL